ncbi:uncharacterized protein N7496_003556 [Penicillium cataractarum]|uniref:Cellular morphogenesis protein n=1 Tax=Penicillium cataractarum TaxID=2100454 RepID=A0A9W9VGB3_9EURO|nr:uncharacterized protein N7496_003556 [Penicillium cataractarum]KAJ5381128.1 hypothetical protein N7496_003556 [Penicillium cataractarum]
MRVSSLYGPAAAGISTLFALLPTAHALTFNAVSTPEIDLSSLGRVTITGDFDGVSLYEYEGQSEITQRQGSYILTPLPNGILTNLSSADAQIRDMCAFTKKDGTFAGIFVGGNFTKLGGVKSPGAALFNPNSSDITALPGLTGSVSTVLCDQDTNRVYVGGDFTHKNTSNAIAWSPSDGWTELEFDGLNGPVNSIIKGDNGHIIFGGSFDGLGNTTSSSNNKQILNLQNATITSDAESSLTGYIDPRNVICSTSGVAGAGKTWLLHDYAPGYWRAYFGFTFNPTKVRLYNTHLDGRGTKSFLFRALPDDGIMNMTYTDDSGNTVHCDSSCPLSDSTSEKYRDFTLVNPVGMKGFQIEVLDWYGQGAGLNGIEVFQDQILSYAVDAFNEPSCAGLDYPSKSTRTGSWTVEDAGYLSASVTDSNDTSTSVVFYPDIKESGNYTILVYTPGCVQDDSCSSRGMANVTATVATGTDASQPSPTTIYQTNNYDKYDTLFSGYVDASSDSFRPSVTLRPISGQGDITLVASKVRFELLSNTTSGGLNGLYDFDPSSTTTASLDSSDINVAGNSLDKDAVIMSLAENDGIFYVAGNFSTKKIHNVMSITDGNATAMPSGGLNSEVMAMTTLNDVLYVGGQFTDTSDGGADGLYHVASYSFSSKKWSALGEGLNGQVNSIYPIQLNVSTSINETTIAVSGNFNQIRATSDHPAVYVAGFAIWVPSKKAWLQSLNDTQMKFAGQLSAVATFNDTTLLAGSLATDGITASGAVSLQNSNDLTLVPLSMNTNHTASTVGIITGVYDTESNRNLTIVGGQFTALSSNGSAIHNVAFLNGTEEKIFGLPQGLDSNSTVYSMAVYNNTLFVGGNITGTLASSSVSGMVAYDLSSNSFKQSQPWSLTGKNSSVNSMALRPGSSELYVGGSFDSAGSLPCTTVCALDTSVNTWSWPGASISGTVMSLSWASSNTLYAVGNIEIGDNKTVVATFSKKTSAWTAFSGASTSDITGTVTAFAPASEDISNFWLGGTSTNGSAFLLNYDGSKFRSAGSLFSKGTTIRGLEILPINQDHSSVSLLKNDQTLLIMGELVIPDFGNASAALYNGTAVTPFILSSKYNGEPGSMSQLFTENQNPYTTQSSHHSNGIVVLVAFCCALGCVFLIVAAGVIANKIQRRRQGYSAAPQTFGTDRPTDMQRVPPEYLFNSLRQPNPGAPVI